MKKKVFSFLLSLCMVLTLVPMSAMADPVYVAQNGSVQYEALQTAIDEAQAGETITLLGNVELTAGLEIASDDVITLDLNGHTISYVSSETQQNATISIDYNGALTVKDSFGGGKIAYQSNNPSAAYSYATDTILNGGSFTLESGTLENTTSGGASYAIDTKWYTDGSTTAAPTTTINGGTITTIGRAIRIVAYSEDKTNTLNVNGGAITGDMAVQITLMNSSNAYYPKADVNITGGTLTGNSGWAFYSISNGASYTGADIDITGGTFEGDVAVGGGSAKGGVGAESLDITGGAFNSTYGVYTYNSSAEDIDITGGTYVALPDDEYFAEGYTYTANTDSTYTVVAKSIYFAQNAISATKSAEATLTNELKYVGEAETYDGDEVVYESSNVAVATVAVDGTVTVVGSGSTVITATLTDGSYQCSATYTLNLTLNAEEGTADTAGDASIAAGETALQPSIDSTAAEELSAEAESIASALVTDGAVGNNTVENTNALTEVAQTAKENETVHVALSVKVDDIDAETATGEVASDVAAIDGKVKDNEDVVAYFNVDVDLVVTVLDKDGVPTANTASSAVTELNTPVYLTLTLNNVDATGMVVRILSVHEGYTYSINPTAVEVSGTDTKVTFPADKFSTYAAVLSDSCEVLFDSQGGSAVDAQNVAIGSTVAVPANPTLNGYNFTGWYTDAGCTNAYDFTAEVTTATMTLYAGWAKVSAPIIYRNECFATTTGEFKDVEYFGTAVKPGDTVTLKVSTSDLGDQYALDYRNITVVYEVEGAVVLTSNYDYANDPIYKDGIATDIMLNKGFNKVIAHIYYNGIDAGTCAPFYAYVQ